MKKVAFYRVFVSLFSTRSARSLTSHSTSQKQALGSVIASSCLPTRNKIRFVASPSEASQNLARARCFRACGQEASCWFAAL